MKLENNFRKRLCDALVSRYGSSIYIQKNHGNEYSAGLPDVYAQLLTHGSVHIELKAVDKASFDWAEQPTKLQMSVLRKIHLAGGRVGVILYVAEHNISLAVHGETLLQLVTRGVRWTRGELAYSGVHTLGPHPLMGARFFSWGREVPFTSGHPLADHVFGGAVGQ